LALFDTDLRHLLPSLDLRQEFAGQILLTSKQDYTIKAPLMSTTIFAKMKIFKMFINGGVVCPQAAALCL
uniref:hypothetical protein n=1 Tax=Gemmiger sp. TaxID=2049027 RepID=UPI003FEE6D61